MYKDAGMVEPNDYNVRAVERALQILKSFDDLHPERGVSEISEIVGLHKATTHRLLATLMNYGFIERSDDGQKYRLGLQLIDLGFKVTRRMDVRSEALPYLKQLAEKLDEAVDLSVYYQGQVLYIEIIPSHHALTIAAAVGQRFPLYCTASGKLFLSALSTKERDEILKGELVSFTNQTITNKSILLTQLELIRKNGYSIDEEELESGVRAVAAPIFNQKGVIVAAVSIPGPASRLTKERIPGIASELKETTKMISLRIGWSG
jgi:IclR family transcriptional regulator, KDG regulon repressor